MNALLLLILFYPPLFALDLIKKATRRTPSEPQYLVVAATLAWWGMLLSGMLWALWLISGL